MAITLTPRFWVSTGSTTVFPLLYRLQPHMSTTPECLKSGRQVQPAATPPAMTAPLFSTQAVLP